MNLIKIEKVEIDWEALKARRKARQEAFKKEILKNPEIYSIWPHNYPHAKSHLLVFNKNNPRICDLLQKVKKRATVIPVYDDYSLICRNKSIQIKAAGIYYRYATQSKQSLFFRYYSNNPPKRGDKVVTDGNL